MLDYLYPIVMLVGTTMGVGLFGLPYVTAQFGFFPTLGYFFILGALILTIQLLVGEIALRTPGNHRMPGYVEQYLGKKAKILSVFSNSAGLFGANLAYIIVGGSFLSHLLIPFFGANTDIYTIIYFAAGAFIIFFGGKAIARSELISLAILLSGLAYLAIKGVPFIQPQNYLFQNFHYFFEPYGLILFSLAGMSIIPEMREILTGKEKKLYASIILGTLIPIVAYIGFILLVVGVTGQKTTPDAFSGLQNILGSRIVEIGYFFAIITTFKAYLSTGLTLKKIFWYDMKFSHFSAWVIAAFIPIILYFIGLQNSILVMSITGSVTLAIDGILVFLIHDRAQKKQRRQPEYRVTLPSLLRYFLIAIFLVGAVVTLVII